MFDRSNSRLIEALGSIDRSNRYGEICRIPVTGSIIQIKIFNSQTPRNLYYKPYKPKWTTFYVMHVSFYQESWIKSAKIYTILMNPKNFFNLIQIILFPEFLLLTHHKSVVKPLHVKRISRLMSISLQHAISNIQHGFSFINTHPNQP